MKCVIVFCIALTLTVTSNGLEFFDANNHFTASIYKKTSKYVKGNLLVSPFSTELALLLALSGARGETAKELRAVLHLPDDDQTIKPSAKRLLVSLTSSRDYLFYLANKIFIQKFSHIKEQFKQVARDVFFADVDNIDFNSNTEAADKINQWVKKYTDNKIHSLISPESIVADTSLMIINALYFQGNWSRPFRSFFTNKESFYRNISDVVQVETMKAASFYNYSENYHLNAKYLEIPFKNEEATMTLVLPNDIEGLESLENQIEEILSPQTFSKEFVRLELPKFKTESTIDFEDILKNLGITRAFNINGADFSGISDDRLSIDKVLQKTFINVNEDGVKAAAATSIRIFPRYGYTLDDALKVFIANHPFLYFIRIKGLIVFIGRVVWPEY